MPKRIVITGSTRGIGRGLAAEFLARGCRVAVSGRSAATVAKAVAELGAAHNPDRVAGCACDVTDADRVRALWDAACGTFGGVDIWINNAGVSVGREPLWEQSDEDLRRVVEANLTGTLFGLKVPIAAMLAQGHGQVWLTEGFGSDGATQPGMAAYGATKRAVRYLRKALQADLAATPVQVGTLSPGIVVTDLLTGDYDPASEEWARARRIFNILGDRVETVTPWLAEQVLAADKSGSRIAWLTRRKAFARFMLAALRKRDLFD
jgi:NAD(P)-dependent dehydrogenase (short-subunit alcohol dehydrogenase family)